MEGLLKITGSGLLLFMAITDIKKRKIPAVLMLIFGCVAILLQGKGVTQQALWGCIPGVFILLLNKLSRGQVGIGDGVMLIGSGIYLGGYDSLKVFIYSLGLVFMYCCAGLTLKRLSRRSQLPFAPFYFAAYLGVVYL